MSKPTQMRLRELKGITLYSYDEIWAKKKYPLEKHIRDCLRLFKRVKQFKEPVALRVAEQSGIDVRTLWDSAFLTVALHDIGKASIPFQRYIRNGKRESHAFISFYFVDHICSSRTPLRFDGYPIGLEALAVASHHSPLHPSKFEMYEGNEDSPQILEDAVARFLTKFVSRQSEEFLGEPLDWEESFPRTYNEIFKILAVRNARLRRSRTLSNNSVRLPFAFLKSILHYCDWYASARDFNPQYSPNSTKSKVLRYLRKKKKKPIKLRYLQKESEKVHDAILHAPTGTGKTEAAIVWADKYAESKKLLYLLPTMTTSNKMHDRLGKTLGCEIGLLHGTSDYMLRVNEEHETQEEMAVIRKSLFSKSFINPCTVATVDQLIFTMFNWGRWELKLMNAGNSAITVDEIHAYEPYTVALIVETLKALQPLGAKCFIMSATIPTVLKKFLVNQLNLTEVPRDTSFDKRVRTSIKLRLNETIPSAIPKILEFYQRKRKILVICNTVATSKIVFKELRKEKRIRRNTLALFHSQFIMKDRATKENLLENLEKKRGPFILVATQVVEVSLDIDFNILFTEACPIDALIQRLGRVNREGKHSPAPVFIYKQTSNADRVYDPELVGNSVNQFCLKSRSELKEFEFAEMVDNVYNGMDYENKLQEELKKIRTLIADVQDNLRYVYRLTAKEKMLQQVVTRKSDYVTINVIPKDFGETALNLPKDERYKRIEYTVKVPFYRVRRFISPDEHGVIVADIDYSKELGVIYPDRETETFIY